MAPKVAMTTYHAARNRSNALALWKGNLETRGRNPPRSMRGWKKEITGDMEEGQRPVVHIQYLLNTAFPTF